MKPWVYEFDARLGREVPNPEEKQGETLIREKDEAANSRSTGDGSSGSGDRDAANGLWPANGQEGGWYLAQVVRTHASFLTRYPELRDCFILICWMQFLDRHVIEAWVFDGRTFRPNPITARLAQHLREFVDRMTAHANSRL